MSGTKVEASGLVKDSIWRYINEIMLLDESEIRLLQMGMGFNREQGVEILRNMYL